MAGVARLSYTLFKPSQFKEIQLKKAVIMCHGLFGDSSPVLTSTQKPLLYAHLMKSTDLSRFAGDIKKSISDVRLFLMNEWKSVVPDNFIRSFLLTNLIEKEGVLCWKVNVDAIICCWTDIIGFPDDELLERTFCNPVLFVSGGKSNYITPDDVPKIYKYFTNARLVSISNAGHWVHIDATKTVIQLISEFLQGGKNLDLIEDVKNFS